MAVSRPGQIAGVDYAPKTVVGQLREVGCKVTEHNGMLDVGRCILLLSVAVEQVRR